MQKNYLNKMDESGRSMVEMLGVLAIIGVLSVGGISGYTTAMNKHKANEILNAAAVRAMAVSAQIQSGVDPSTATASVTPETVGTAEIGSASPVGTEQFKLVFTNDIDESICNQMKNIAGDNSAVGVACDRLLYNNDMSNGVNGKNTNIDTENSTDDNIVCQGNFDPATNCEDCKEGYALEGNECKSSGSYYRLGSILDGHLDLSNVSEGGCPTGYHWATYTEMKDLDTMDISSLFTSSSSICDNCIDSDDYYLYLKDCADSSRTGVAECTEMSKVWYISSYSYQVVNDFTHLDDFDKYDGYAICVRN